ncbi:glycosyltransferase family 2 protein [Salisediminibacterium selenitireducens]|uniref:Glycosyl transferase family 2 n=1 Tax=Bacillus selenitireducens (strain ATCC 700615 / DSM 15326 / MLS10) TaxID=439292 RepID=D6Y1F4_BACIE|nr:glycosyltransferase [Salisediminibacterium selenitireducens]ADI00741.1 glycosyl transferase family 2 [[Bacillus] selenitireducens MLS10]
MTTDWLVSAVEVLAWMIVIYMLFVSLLYIVLFSVAMPKIRREQKLNRIEQIEGMTVNQDTYPISVLVPAYNEEVGIVASVNSLLTLNYPEYEVIVINDGSDDETSLRIKDHFNMKPVKLAMRKHFQTAEVTAAYQSSEYGNLYLIEKENGGKGDALNAGINFSSYPYFASIDADSILEKDALLKTMKPIIDSNGEVTATGGTVRIANGCQIEKSVVQTITLPKKPLEVMQIIEYFRGFLIGRLGFSRTNMLMIVSGAFGVFEKSRVIRVGGYDSSTVGEDMELVVRIHRSIKDEKSPQRIEYIQDPVCWTEAPSTFSSLKSQRIRWQRGLTETIWKHKGMMFNPKYKRVGLFSLPYYTFVELLSAVVEFFGYLIIILGLVFAFIDPAIAGMMFAVTILYGSLLSSLSVLLEEWTYHKYQDVKSLPILFLYALTEVFWYRPLTVSFRLVGLFSAFGRKREWGNMERKGIDQTEEKAV